MPAPTIGAPGGVVDSIVQGSTVDLFEAYSVAVAPLARTRGGVARRQASEFTGIINFSGKGGAGSLMLGLPMAVLTQMKMDPRLSIKKADWTRELTNQLVGRIKNRLLRFQYDLQAGLPTVLERRLFEQRAPLSESAMFYGFRTLRGEIQVILDGTIDESLFAYSGKIVVPSEGDVILF
jgi:hypothetical protein